MLKLQCRKIVQFTLVPAGLRPLYPSILKKNTINLCQLGEVRMLQGLIMSSCYLFKSMHCAALHCTAYVYFCSCLPLLPVDIPLMI